MADLKLFYDYGGGMFIDMFVNKFLDQAHFKFINQIIIQ